MTRSCQALLIILAGALAAPAHAAQAIQGRITGSAAAVMAVPQLAVGALGARISVGMPLSAPALSALTPDAPAIAPTVAPQAGLLLAPAPILSEIPVLAPAAVAPGAPVRMAAPAPEADSPSGPAAKLSEAVAPGLDALSKPDLKSEEASAAAQRVMEPVLGKTAASDSIVVPEPGQTPAPVVKTSRAKKQPAALLSDVSFSEGVSAQHQALFIETLSRRKAGWIRQLAAMGVKLEGPVAPVVTVKSSRDIAKGTKVEYTVDWAQGETHVGSFKAVVTLKNVNPELRRLAAPEPAKGDQIRLRFKKTVIANADGLNVEVAVTDQDIAGYLEEKGLRLLSKGWDGYYTVSVTGKDQADAVADAVSGKGIVLYATPVTFTIPEANQVQIVFKQSTVRSFGGLNAETSVSETEISALLREKGLRVLSIDRDGLYTVGAQDLGAAAMAGDLQNDAAVLYSKPLKFDPPAASQLIVSLRDKYILSAGGLNIENAVSEDDVSSLLQRHGLMVVKILNNGAYKVARVSDGTPAKDLVSAVSQEPIVKDALALGGVTDEQIQSAARGVASYKGRPWSSTEYNMAYGTTYWSLEERGATPEQLKLFEKLCDEAPVRGGGFNPWSGD